MIPRVPFLVAFTCLSALTIRAQTTDTWSSSPTGNTFGVATNWVSGVAPASGDNLVFGATSISNLNVGISVTANSVTFNGSFPHYVLNGSGQTFSIGAGGITLSATGTSTSSSSVDFNGSLPIALTANQTWTTNGPANGNLTVSGNVSGGSGITLTKAGTGYLVLSGSDPSLNSNVTVSAGALYLGQSSSMGTGTITVGGSGSLGSTGSDITLTNAVTLNSGATLGGSLNSGSSPALKLSGNVTVSSAATTLNLASQEVSFTGNLTGSTTTALTFNSTAVGVAIISGNVTNISSMTANNTAIAFATTASFPSTSIQATNGGYVSVADPGTGTAPPVSTLLALITNKASFNGTIGFDTGNQASTVHVYNDAIDLTGFTSGQVSLGTVSNAVLTGPITPVGQSYDFAGFGSQSGGLFVQSNLTDHNSILTGVTVSSPNSGGAGPGGMAVIFQGNNSFTGNLTVSNSFAILDSANALPNKFFSMGANSYVGYTEAATNYTSFTDFASHLTGSYSSTSVLGLDSHAVLVNFLATGSSSGVTRTVTDTIDLSGFSSISLGTALGAVTIDSATIKAPADGVLRLVNFSGKAGDFTISSALTTSNNVNSLVAGQSGSEGMVVLTGTNNYAGGTTLQGGGLLVGNNSALGTGAITVLTSAGGNGLTLGASSGTVSLTNNIAVTDNLNIGTGTTDDSGNFTAGTTTLNLSGVISNNGGNGRLYITGPTTLSNNNTYSGGTYVEANTTVTSDHGLGTSFVDLGYNATLTYSTPHPVIGGGSLADASQFLGNSAGSGTIKLDTNVVDFTINQTSSSTFSGQITGTAGPSLAALIKNGSGQLNLTGDNAGQFTGGTMINAGTIAIGNSSATSATFGGNVTLAGGSLSFQPGAGQNMTYSGNITSTGTGNVTISGSSGGTVSISGGASTFTGNTTVNNGTLDITLDNLWSASSNTSVNGGAKLQIDGNQTFTNLSGSGNVVISTTAKALTVNSTVATTVSGNISGNGGLTKNGTSTFTLNGTNSYTGVTTINSGTLQIGQGGTTGSVTSSSIVNNGTLAFSRSDATSYGGVISSTGNVIKNGAGSLTLSGTNTYTGATSVNSGTLFVNGSLTSSAVSVAPSATLAGIGTLGAGATIQNTSHLDPGNNAAGTITFTNGLTLLSGAVLDFQLGATSDKIRVSGGMLNGLTSGSVTLNLSNVSGFIAGTYTLFDFSGATNNNFDAGDFGIGTQISGFNSSLAISGTTLVLTATAIPEPSTCAALLGMGALAVAAWRRRRAQVSQK